MTAQSMVRVAFTLAALLFLASGSLATSLTPTVLVDSQWTSTNYGQSVSIYKDAILVGGEGVDGVSVFRPNASGVGFSVSSRLSSFSQSSSWGSPTALGANAALVGDWGYQTSQGLISVFEMSGGSYGGDQDIPGPSPNQLSEFGASLAISGNIAAVGAPQYSDQPYVSAGGVQMFIDANNDGLGWQPTYFLNDAVADGDMYGASVAFGDGVLAIGAPHVATVGGHSGVVFIYSNSSGDFQQTTKIVGYQPEDGDQFGSSVVFSGTSLLIAAVGKTLSFGNQGAAYVYDSSASSFQPYLLVAVLKDPNGSYGDAWGTSIGFSGNLAAVGSPAIGHGRVIVYSRNQGGQNVFNPVASLAPQHPDSGFGASIAFDGNTLVVGVTVSGPAGNGGAYVYNTTSLA